jgi:hypothetical protein
MELWINEIVGVKRGKKIFFAVLTSFVPNIPTFQYSFIPDGTKPVIENTNPAGQ